MDRELGLLDFNRRVLEHARDPRTPLLERLRFLAISTANLDEFFEIRVAGLKERATFGAEPGSAGASAPSELLPRIGESARRLVEDQYRALNDEILPALEANGVTLLRRSEWSEAQRDWLQRFFSEQVRPVLAPLGLDPAHPFPRIPNKSLNLAVALDGEDAFGRRPPLAVVQVPRSLPRVIALPREISPTPWCFVLLSSVIHAHVEQLFTGVRVASVQQFRMTRNSDLWVDEEEVEDLLDAVRGELPRRRYGEPVRLELPRGCPPEERAYLLDQVGLSEEDLYLVDGPVNLHRLGQLYDLVDRPDLKYPPLLPAVPPRLRSGAPIWNVLREGDVLLHHPYESFTPVIEFVQAAARDPDVLAIRQTLYRTGPRSPVVDALIDAAQAGKEVTVVVELRARFDEAENIDLATRLQDAGASVVYGVVGYKAHAKLCLVVRREGGALVRYAHLGTGNYHAGTARGYTDLGLLTADPAICADVHEVFGTITSVGTAPSLRRLVQSPFSLSPTLLRCIERETEEARAGRPARITARMNALSDPPLIRALYRASQAGVRVDLLVRGACGLRPGIPGVSKGIRVRSIVGRFLEHGRVFRFFAAGEDLLFCSSADWMPRNLYRRIEVAWPVNDAAMKARIVQDCLDLPLADDSQAWELRPDGGWVRVRPAAGATALDSQRTLLKNLTGGD
jgi:polyphosphate kinase